MAHPACACHDKASDKLDLVKPVSCQATDAKGAAQTDDRGISAMKIQYLFSPDWSKQMLQTEITCFLAPQISSFSPVNNYHLSLPCQTATAPATHAINAICSSPYRRRYVQILGEASDCNKDWLTQSQQGSHAKTQLRSACIMIYQQHEMPKQPGIHMLCGLPWLAVRQIWMRGLMRNVDSLMIALRSCSMQYWHKREPTMAVFPCMLYAEQLRLALFQALLSQASKLYVHHASMIQKEILFNV